MSSTDSTVVTAPTDGASMAPASGRSSGYIESTLPQTSPDDHHLSEATSPTRKVASASSPDLPYTSLQDLSDDWTYAVELWYVYDIKGSLREHRRILRRLLPTLPPPLPESSATASEDQMSSLVKHLWYNIGFLLSNKGDDALAAEAFLESVKIDDSFVISWYGLAVAYYGLRSFSRSSRAFRAILAVMDAQKVGWIKTNLTVDVTGKSRGPVSPAELDGNSSPVLFGLKKKKSWLIDRASIVEMNDTVMCLKKNKHCEHGNFSRSTCQSMDWMLPDHITFPVLKASQSGSLYTRRYTSTGAIRLPKERQSAIITMVAFARDIDNDDEVPLQESSLNSPLSNSTTALYPINTSVVAYPQGGEWQPHTANVSPTGEILDLYFRVDTSELEENSEEEVDRDDGEMLLPRRFVPGGEPWQWE